MLLVSINFSPEMTGIGPVAREYADVLHAAGHRIGVITGVPHYPMWRKIDTSGPSVPYRVQRCWHYVPPRQSSLRRVLYEASFAASVWTHLRRSPRVDLLLTITPTLASTYIATRWASSNGVPAATIVQDIVSVGVAQTRMAGGIVVGAAAALEHAAFGRSRLIGIVSDAMRAKVERNGAAPDRIRLLPNWPVGELGPFPARDGARGLFGFRQGEFVAVHAGNMGLKQGLEVIVDAAKLLGPESSIRFILIGDGNQRESLERRARGVAAVELWPLQPEDRLLAALAAADALLLTQRPTITDMAFPSKLTTYARAGVPIIASVAPDSAVGQVLKRTGAAMLVEPGSPHALLLAIASLRESEPLRDRLSRAVRAYYASELNPNRLRAHFLAFALEAAATGRSRRLG